MSKVKRKKLNFTVKKDFQVWLFLRILITIFVSAVVAVLILYFYARREVGESFYGAHIEIRRVSDLLLPVILAGSVVSMLSGALIAIFLPQKIAGPIYRLENNLKTVGEGNLTVSTTLRSGDVLKDFALTLDNTVSLMRSRIVQLKEVHAELGEFAKESNQPELRSILERENKILEDFQTETEKFS